MKRNVHSKRKDSILIKDGKSHKQRHISYKKPIHFFIFVNRLMNPMIWKRHY